MKKPRASVAHSTPSAARRGITSRSSEPTGAGCPTIGSAEDVDAGIDQARPASHRALVKRRDPIRHHFRHPEA